MSHNIPYLTMTLGPDWSKGKNELLRNVCALRNTCSGGQLILGPIEESDQRRSVEQKIEGLGSQSLLFEIKITFDNLTRLLVIVIPPAESLCCLDSGIFYPTETQVVEISLQESRQFVRKLLTMAPCKEYHLPSPHKEFIKEQKTVLHESSKVQLKKFKDERSKSTTLAARMTKKCNKITQTISAFANCSGGIIYCGIQDDLTIKGHILNQDQKRAIISNLDTVIRKMIWPEQCGVPQRGKQWDVAFLQVTDDRGSPIPSIFVIAISVAACPGGVFAESPKSYFIQNDEVEEMSLDDCMEGMMKTSKTDEQKENPEKTGLVIYRNLHPDTSQLSKSETAYMRLTEQFDCLRENGKWKEFNGFISELRSRSNTTIVRLMLTFQHGSAAYMQVLPKKAKQMLQQYQKLISSANVTPIIELEGRYLQVAIQRCEGNFKECYDTGLLVLEKLQTMPVSMTTAWFYYIVAVHVTIFALEQANEGQKQKLLELARTLMFTATEQARKLDYVPTASSHLQQAITVQNAMLHLNSSLHSKRLFDKPPINGSGIDVSRAERLLSGIEQKSLSLLNQCHLLIAKTDLSVRYGQQTCNEQDELQYFERATSFATQACLLAKENRFQEIFKYSEMRRSILVRDKLCLQYSSS